METFEDFDEALAYFRESGGAMNYGCELHGKSRSLWFVGDGQWIAEMVEPMSAKEATVHALETGGLSESEIKQIMQDWID